MTGLRTRLWPVPAPVVDVALAAASLLDLWNMVDPEEGRFAVACALLASLALVLRRRAPLPVLVLTMPAVLVTSAVIAAQIALYTVARRTRDRTLLTCCATVFTACYVIPWPDPRPAGMSGLSTLAMLGYGLANAAAPIFLGQLVQARHELRARLAEITATREHERLLVAQQVLATERARLAREMHDVVSHQVSLIAVRAGALQVSTADADTREAAATIRRLSAQTLDELRHMVGVLRASGSGPTDLTPQPTLDQLHTLVTGSGIETRLDIDLPVDLPLPVQRAVYRTVQEGLTNIRKHAPGATAVVEIRHEDDTVRTTVTNTAPTRPPLALPSARHGLAGLRQRAELLGGTLHAGPTGEHGYRLRLLLPVDHP
jgi:signal transduction histidine kinase